jgi:pantetheine-phosphate adenylyltransferase
MTTAVYAGSFDPVTKGHLDLIYRASKQFDKLIVGVGINAGKTPLFTPPERIALIKACIDDTWHEMHKHWNLEAPDGESVDPDKIAVLSFEGLLVDFCLEHKATVIIRGLRAVTDFEQELGIAQANASMVPNIDTFFLPTRSKFSAVSSSVVREIARHSSDTGWQSLPHYVNKPVLAALRTKFEHK